MITVYYGFNRSDREFKPLGADIDLIFIDDKTTDRAARRAAFIRLEDAGGGKMVLLAHGDLAAGREIAAVRSHLETINVTVEGPGDRGEEKPRKAPAKPSTLSPRFDPPEAVDAELRRRWRQPAMFSTAYLLAWLAREHGIEATRNQLNYRYGKRSADNG